MPVEYHLTNEYSIIIVEAFAFEEGIFESAILAWLLDNDDTILGSLVGELVNLDDKLRRSLFYFLQVLFKFEVRVF